ncbi:MAG TPA: SLC13 family permease [Alphaproteobacteria bacterium]|nr:SLC13 family permease [Alphaproteobacteria bacterium]
MFAIDPTYLMWATLLLAVATIALFAVETIAIEITSVGLIAVMLILFQLFPVVGPKGQNLLDAERLLAGFANSALITVIALLVVGQGVVRTGALDRVAQRALQLGGGNALWPLVMILVMVAVISAFINNTPMVVIFIPITQAIAAKSGRSISGYMMPMCFAATLGGITTLIGTSTNLLVSSSLIDLGQRPLGFFDLTVPGVILAAVGLFYLLVFGPRLLPARASLAGALVGEGGKQFIAQITVPEGSRLVGMTAVLGLFPKLRDVTVQLIQRGEHAELPPFDSFALQPGDLLIVAATRKALMEAVAQGEGVLHPHVPGEEAKGEVWGAGDQILAEAMVTPASRLIGQTLEQIGFRYRYHCIALGVQRRSRMIRARMTEIPLEAGDVLLVQGRREDVLALRANRDILPMEWSMTDLPAPHLAGLAGLVFAAVVGLAAFEVLPIVVAAMIGVVAMIAVGALNVRQALQAVDARIILLVGAALALGAAMQETGGAVFVAHGFIGLFAGAPPAVILSAFFLVVAVFTNVLSNNACAVLFTPIAVGLAQSLGVDPMIFAIAVAFGANCSFATPIGYQTNLLVMGPGHYRFSDYMRVGIPLVLLLWLTFSALAPFYFRL